MSKKLPTKYISTLPRVSSIVEYIYPFNWEDKDRFLKWLGFYWISHDDYMKEASTWGTFVHKKLEDYARFGKVYKWKQYWTWINAWIKFINENVEEVIATEEYIRTKDYQWTIDLIATIDWKKYILDWKTYSLAKNKFWLTSTYRKPYDKLKKARLQLSLYARAKKINNIAVIELSPDWKYHFHILEKYSSAEMNSIISEFNNNYIDEL